MDNLLIPIAVLFGVIVIYKTIKFFKDDKKSNSTSGGRDVDFPNTDEDEISSKK